MELKKREGSRDRRAVRRCPHLDLQLLKLLRFGLPRAPGPFPAVREFEGPKSEEPGVSKTQKPPNRGFPGGLC